MLRRCADRLYAQKGLDDDHRPTAVRTNESGLDALNRSISASDLYSGGGRYLQQRTYPREVGLALGIGEQPIMTDAVKAVR